MQIEEFPAESEVEKMALKRKTGQSVELVDVKKSKKEEAAMGKRLDVEKFTEC